MTVKDLKEHLNSLPEELDDFDISYCEVQVGLNEQWIRKDIPLESIAVDGTTNELLLAKKSTLDVIDNLMSHEK